MEPVTQREPESTTTPDAIVRCAREHQGEIVFAFVGPLTNLAVALALEPRIVEWVTRLVIMGGAFFGPGNVTPHAEFNIFVDPEAAAAVARSGMRATWIGLDVTHQTALHREAWEALAGDGLGCSLVREVCRNSYQVRGRDRVFLHDPLAVATLERPDLVETVAGTVVMDVDPHVSGRTRLAGALTGEQPALVAQGVDVEAFEDLFSRVTA